MDQFLLNAPAGTVVYWIPLPFRRLRTGDYSYLNACVRSSSVGLRVTPGVSYNC